MSSRLKRVVKGALRPLRKALGRFALGPEAADKSSIAYCAGRLIAAEKIQGDYLEFGVFRGDSFISAYRAIELAFDDASTPGVWNLEKDCEERRQLWSQMRFFAFDSFEGLPSLTGADRQTRDFVAGKYRASPEEFTTNLRKGGLPLERVTVVPGWFDEVLNERTIDHFELNNAAIVHIDCDLYESAIAVLEFLTPLLSEGAVVIFDDWYCFKANPDLGEQRACREWCAANPELHLTEYHKEGPWKNSFIVNRRSSSGDETAGTRSKRNVT